MSKVEINTENALEDKVVAVLSEWFDGQLDNEQYIAKLSEVLEVKKVDPKPDKKSRVKIDGE